MAVGVSRFVAREEWVIYGIKGAAGVTGFPVLTSAARFWEGYIVLFT